MFQVILLHDALITGAASFGETLLFFGNRHRQQDFLYQSEFEALLQSGALTELHTAFSRDQPEKVCHFIIIFRTSTFLSFSVKFELNFYSIVQIYVQHRLREQGFKITDMILRRVAYFFVCGFVIFHFISTMCLKLQKKTM